MLLSITVFNAVKAQHYLFIEADGQQPFYVKNGSMMVSSSASGFLILPKITTHEMTISIGFPKNTYPEVSFYISGTDRDRGFQLKRMEGQGWSLFDRSSLDFIKGEVASNSLLDMQLNKKSQGNFASLLAAATDDNSLLTPIPKKDLAETTSSPKAILAPRPVNNESKQDKIIGIHANKLPKLPMFSSSIQTDNALLKRLIYIETSPTGRPDTIMVEIEKVFSSTQALISENKIDKGVPSLGSENIDPNIVNATKQLDSSSGKQALSDVGPIAGSTDVVAGIGAGHQKPMDSPSQLRKTNPIVVCDRPFADDKDLRLLRKKLLGMAAEDAQFIYTVKVFGQKCFNTKQALEIGWLFVDEGSRLKLFTLLRPLVSDPVFFRDLESSFFKEENIKAFRALFTGSN